ncbi:hypothetical protein SLS58_011138 [Diplodia intermedia]|uniref:Rhodopsin domain-containing protein n=1 Tax=Diplodia intermedia TaxID=856260 RepID=A0ABR3T1F9_9PEZI
MIKHLFWLCGVTYLAVVLTLTFGCFPFSDNWAVAPTLPARKCTFKTQNLLVTVVLNVITDAAILVIPIPMLWRLKVAMSRKLAIAALLSSGVFVIGAAITRAALTLGEAPSALNINRWGVRETIVGIVAVQLPLLRPLFVRDFWRRGRYVSSGSGGGGSGGANAGSTNDIRTGTHGTVTLGSAHRTPLSKKGYGDGGVGAIELHSQAGSDVVDLERASTYSGGDKEHAIVEWSEREREREGGKGGVVGAQVQARRGESVSSGDGSEDGFVERAARSDVHRQQYQRTLSGGVGGVGGQQQQALAANANNLVFVETTYEIRREGRRSSADVDGVATGEVGCDTRITAVRGWGR